MKGKVLGTILFSLLASNGFAASHLSNATMLSHRTWTTGHAKEATIASPMKAKSSLMKFYKKQMRHQGFEDMFAVVSLEPVGEVNTNQEVTIYGNAMTNITNDDSKTHKYKVTSVLCTIPLDGDFDESDCINVENIFIINAYGYLDFDQNLGLTTIFKTAGEYAQVGGTMIQRDDKNVIYNTANGDLIVASDSAPQQK